MRGASQAASSLLLLKKFVEYCIQDCIEGVSLVIKVADKEGKKNGNSLRVYSFLFSLLCQRTFSALACLSVVSKRYRNVDTTALLLLCALEIVVAKSRAAAEDWALAQSSKRIETR